MITQLNPATDGCTTISFQDKPDDWENIKQMTKNPKRPGQYDLRASERKRSLAIQFGLTAVVVLFAVGLVLYIVVLGDKKAQGGEIQAVRVVSSDVMTSAGSSDPMAVISLYEDFQCPHCAAFEKAMGPTLNKLVDSGIVAIDYYMVAILDTPTNKNYSTRAANAAYCVAEEDKTPSKEYFRNFHGALFAQQPAEGSPAPDNAALTETARQAGAAGDVAECVTKGKFDDMVGGLAAAAGINSTPSVRINGADYQYRTPEDLIEKVQEIVGDVPDLDTIPGRPTS